MQISLVKLPNENDGKKTDKQIVIKRRTVSSIPKSRIKLSKLFDERKSLKTAKRERKSMHDLKENFIDNYKDEIPFKNSKKRLRSTKHNLFRFTQINNV
jgi:hypothetical protein